MTDIVERLRLLVPSDSSGAAIKAIDEIIRLRSERSNLIGTVRFHKEQTAALRAKVERLEGALKLFACDCTESSLCKFPHACPNYIARAALGDTHE